MSEFAKRILQSMIANYKVGWSIAEGKILYDAKKYDPTIVELYKFPHEFDDALKELAKAKFIEKHPIFPDWEILKFPIWKKYRINHDKGGYFGEEEINGRWFPLAPSTFRHDLPETAIDAVMEFSANDENPPSRKDIKLKE